ncbi:MAG: phosphoglycerate kinase [Armatimonadetes bacterium CG2_30_59_28]|nr:phosphoglycerate kinase [Armatimonadota bacterium]OIO92126.1 MAG: phosphoglycerate kinase [Armatimonadetes bacterium CG2_30_59_28]PIU65579.1 MAG: phosphoglycerate kinase [Armatimonadetes bacterium CG07_land_8_20_14_0_80_59_28]PIY39227.1 MAG: phosphoglycerate kinase [Armatimonadetes bacterium CG_4_10_14_3_um_filter_59_10]
MNRKKSVCDIDVKGKRVFVRVDFNVPLDENQKITSDSRIVASLPTIQYLLDQNARVILGSHLGRPKGEVRDDQRLTPVARRLHELLGRPVKMLDDCIGDKVIAAVNAMQDGDVVLLENLRFHKGEEKNDPEFVKELASLAEVYVNDAFGTAHRAHASTEGIARLLKPAAAGFLMQKELEMLGGMLANPERPFVGILGGVKVSDKIKVIRHLMDKVDSLLIGGAMMFTFYRAQELETGRSLVEEDKIDLARQLLESGGSKLCLPTDVVVSESPDEPVNLHVVPCSAIPENALGMDVGPETVKAFGEKIAQSRTVCWNGPMGRFEVEAFAAGTRGVAEAIANSDATSVIGGGDSASAVTKMGLSDKITHVSTGGGASLEFLEGVDLPGVAVLEDA